MNTYHFTTTIFMNDLELKAEVMLDYQPAEDPTFYEPGCEAIYEIVGFKVEGIEAPDFMFRAYEDLLIEDAEAYMKDKLEREKEEKAEYQLDWAA
jgi:hypothetical protein